MPGNEQLARDLASLTAGEVGQLELRQFPDGETYVIQSDVKFKDVFVVCTLAKPNSQFVPLAFTAAAIAELGATSVKLIAPYLAYMRQDRIFHAGEALTSRLFAELLQQHFDGLITVDPHLHRYASLDEVYDIPTTVVHSAPLFANWIATHVDEPVVVGPDVGECPVGRGDCWRGRRSLTVFKKERRGDRNVRMGAPLLHGYRGRTPVLVDDIVSSGVTMKQAVRILTQRISARLIALRFMRCAPRGRRFTSPIIGGVSDLEYGSEQQCRFRRGAAHRRSLFPQLQMPTKGR